jgi:ABC-type transporter Mla MlaB component
VRLSIVMSRVILSSGLLAYRDDRYPSENSPPAACDEFSAAGRSFLQMAASAQHPLAFAIAGPIARADLPGLCERVCGLLRSSPADVALCDVSGVEPDAVTVDALARLQLAARRHGCRVRLRHASSELLELVALMGLTDVLAE